MTPLPARSASRRRRVLHGERRRRRLPDARRERRRAHRHRPGGPQGAGLFAFDDATAYVLAADSTVVAVPLDGSPQKTLATGLVGARSIAADDSGVYVATEATTDGSTGPRILRVREGESPAVLAELEKGLVFQLVLDETTVYWTGLGHVGHVGKCVR